MARSPCFSTEPGKLGQVGGQGNAAAKSRHHVSCGGLSARNLGVPKNAAYGSTRAAASRPKHFPTLRAILVAVRKQIGVTLVG
jgi:hypothetical protein